MLLLEAAAQEGAPLATVKTCPVEPTGNLDKVFVALA